MTDTEGTAPGDRLEQDESTVQLPTPIRHQSDRPALQFVKDHPVLTVAGGIVAGALAAALIPRRNREYVTRRSSVLANAVTTAGMALATQALEMADAAKTDARHRAGSFADQAGRLSSSAAAIAQDLISPPESRKSLSDKLKARAGKLKD